MDLLQLLELGLKERITHKLTKELKNPSFSEFSLAFEKELSKQRDALVVLLLDQLNLKAAPQEKEQEPVPGAKLEPSSEIVTRAEHLQRLAMSSPSENERNAAWKAFEKLWQKYHLPSNLGMMR